MTYTLYGSNGSGSFVVEAALVKAGARYEPVTIDIEKGDQEKPSFTSINPMKQVPALKLPDGTLMTESVAMVIHFADAFPAKGLAPKPGTSAHASFLRWMVFMGTNIYEGDLRYFYPQRYTTDPKGIEGVKAAGGAHMKRSIEVIASALDPYVCGKDLSIADVYLTMVAKWGPDPQTNSKLKAVMAKVAADAVYGPVFARHFPG